MKLPEISDFLLETPLYKKIDFDFDDADSLFNLIYFTQKLDCYCPSCDRNSTFIGTNEGPYISGHDVKTYQEMVKYTNKTYKDFLKKFHHIDFYCSRVEEHKMQQTIYVDSNQLFKTGQYPSLAEISQPELKKYRPVLSKEKYTELNRGIGLVTHGIGIGAFVYLRRIFEDLIEEAHTKIKLIDEWNESEFQKSRMAGKIELLKNELPRFLVENKSIYGVLSKGIHELSEQDCMNYFPTVKLGIELILDEKLEEKKRNNKIAEAKKSLSRISSEIKE